jgi:hypothetical protein
MGRSPDMPKIQAATWYLGSEQDLKNAVNDALVFE